jgi:hypothetical protein
VREESATTRERLTDACAAAGEQIAQAMLDAATSNAAGLCIWTRLTP